MDLGCLDTASISVSDKQRNEAFTDSSNKGSDTNDPISANSRVGKSKSPKGNNQSTWNVLNKCTAQIKKHRHRNSSPLNWFPRKKVDSYLKRKIKKLQEVDGMNLTLDETLGDTNPHYSRVLREKMAAREAAHKAMEARRAALVEASWCRILKAARIQSKEAEALLLDSEKAAAEAFEAATAMGVIMYDKPNCPQTHYQIETSYINGGESTTHTITASFDTAFEVDKEVAAAVKNAFVRLANYPPFSKDEFKDLLHKISENPDTGDSNQELPEISSECESESRLEPEIVPEKNGFGSQDLDAKKPVLAIRQSKSKRRQSPEKVNRANLIGMMLERLKCLQEDELSSLATIVATCGLSAALAEVENNKSHYPSSKTDLPSTSVPNSRRMSSLGAGTMRNANLEYFRNGSVRRKQTESELPSLDKFLVKHVSKLEREVQQAKNSRLKESKEITGENPGGTGDGEVKVDSENFQSETTSDLESDFKHSSKFSKETEEAKNSGNNFKTACKNSEAGVPSEEVNHRKKGVPEIPSLDKFLVKRVSRLEKEVQEGKSRRNNDSIEEAKKKADAQEVPSLDKFLVKHVSRLEKEVQEAKSRRNNDQVEESRATDLRKNFESQTDNTVISSFNGVVEEGKENIDLNKEDTRFSEMEQKDTKSRAGWRGRKCKQVWSNDTECDSLDKVLVKHVSRLEKEKMKFNASEEAVKMNRNGISMHSQSQMNEEGSLDQVLIKHKSRLEREKMAAAAQQPAEEHIRHSVTRREARERELQEAWGGLSIGNSIKPHLFKHERDKANPLIQTDSPFNGVVEEGKENIDLNKEDTRFSEMEQKDTKSRAEDTVDSLDKILVKPVHRLEMEKMQAISAGNNHRNLRPQKNQGWSNDTECDSLDKVLVRHVSRLEKEKMMFNASEEAVKVKRNGISMHSQSQMNEEGSLNQVLVKHKSKLEREKMAAAAQQPAEEHIRHSVTRREARERELQEAWGGLSLGNSIKPHLSKLERDKAAWIKAEEEERRQATEGL